MTHGILWAIPTTSFPAESILRGEVEEHCHHLTLGIGNMSFRWLEAIGFEFEARVLHEAWDRKRGVQALVLELPKGMLSLVNTTREQELLGGYRPHITLFTRKGVSPSTSNEMLAEEYNREEPSLKTITFRVEFCPDKDIAKQAKTSFRENFHLENYELWDKIQSQLEELGFKFEMEVDLSASWDYPTHPNPDVEDNFEDHFDIPLRSLKRIQNDPDHPYAPGHIYYSSYSYGEESRETTKMLESLLEKLSTFKV